MLYTSHFIVIVSSFVFVFALVCIFVDSAHQRKLFFKQICDNLPFAFVVDKLYITITSIVTHCWHIFY